MTEPTPIVAPQVNANDESVKLTRWLVEPGDWVEPGELIAEIETSKAVVEVEAEAAGHLAPLVGIDEHVAVGEVLAWLMEIYDPAALENRKQTATPLAGARLCSADAAALMAEHGLEANDVPGEGPIRKAGVVQALAEQNAEPIDWKSRLNALSLSPQATIIYGADLQGSVVMDCLRAADPNCELLLVDDSPERNELLGHPVFPAFMMPQIVERGLRRAHIAISSPAAKLACAARCKEAGLEMVEVRHPTASVSPFANIGEGCFFGPLTLVGPEASIGDYAQINNGASIAHHANVGTAARLSDGVLLAGRVEIGDRTFLGLGVTVNERISIGDDTTVVSGVNIFNHVPANVTVRIDGKHYPNS